MEECTYPRQNWRECIFVDHIPLGSTSSLLFRIPDPTKAMPYALLFCRLMDQLTAQFQHDGGRYSTEYMISSDDLLVGFRGLYSFGVNPRKLDGTDHSESLVASEPDDLLSPPIKGCLSAGVEMYYGLLNKGGGCIFIRRIELIVVSTGLRFVTLPGQVNPLAMTLTVTPLMGHISATYAIKASPYSAFCSRFNFNVYSYESELVVGCEVWQRRQSPGSKPIDESSKFFSANELRDSETEGPVTGVLKARVGSNFDIGFVWEGRFRNVMLSLGATLDLLKASGPVTNVGCEISYSS
jgi:mitochondrial distribution and morphology protein 10